MDVINETISDTGALAHVAIFAAFMQVLDVLDFHAGM